MAILRDFTDAGTQLAITAAYHRVVGLRVDLDSTPPSISVVVGVYASQTARTNGATPLYRLTKTVDGPSVVAFLASAMWKAVLTRIYNTIVKADATWSGGQDVTDPAE